MGNCPLDGVDSICSEALDMRMLSISSVIAGIFVTEAFALPPITFRTVALSGTQAVGAPAGAEYWAGHMGTPSLNNSGGVSFFAETIGVTIPTVLGGIWSEGGGTMSLVAYEQWAAPGTPAGAEYYTFGNPNLNDAGHVSFSANLTGPGVTAATQLTLYGQDVTGVHLVARAGMQAPGAPAGVVLTGPFTADNFNNRGHLTFASTLTGGTVPSGFFTQNLGDLRAVALAGQQAPGMPAGFRFASGHATSVMNSPGTIAFFHRATNGTPQTRDGMWVDRAGTLSLIGGQGLPAPGTGPGVTFSQFDGQMGINDAGTIVFSSWVTGTGVDSNNSRAIWIDRGQGTELLFRTGMNAPGTGSVFSSLETPRVGSGGNITFAASLAGFGLEGVSLWESSASGQARIVARQGIAAPGTPSGVYYNLINGGGVIGMNGRGQIVFHANLAGAGVDSTNNDGIWVIDSDGLVRLVVREGAQIEIAPGLFKTIDGSSFGSAFGRRSGGEDGLSRWFNDRGELAFNCRFTDGSQGIFVASTPEPTSIAFFLAVIVIRVARRATGA